MLWPQKPKLRTPNSSTPWVIHCQTSVHTANQQRGGRGRDPGQVRAWSLPRNDDDQPKILQNKKKTLHHPAVCPFWVPALSLSLSGHVAAGGTWNWILDDRQRRRRPDSELGADTARKWTATEIQFRKTPKIFWFDVLKPSSTSRGKWRIGVGSRSQGNMINFRAALLSSHPERQNFNQHRKKKPTKYCF